MTRVTYGLASSSCNSNRPLKAVADSCTNSNLRLAVNNDMYVNNLLTGASDVEHATQLQDDIIAALKTACFDTENGHQVFCQLLSDCLPVFAKLQTK